MKKFNVALTVSLLFLVCACGSHEKKIEIKGKITNRAYQGKTIYFQQLEILKSGTVTPVLLDSTKIQSGSFAFQGKTTGSPAMGYLSVAHTYADQHASATTEQSNPEKLFALEAGDITVDMDATQNALKGKRLNSKLNKLNELLDSLKKEGVSLQNQIDTITNPNDTLKIIQTENQFNGLRKAINSHVYDLAKGNMKNQFGKFICFHYSPFFNKQQLHDLISQSDSSFRQNPEIRILSKTMERRHIEVGNPYRDFALISQAGKRTFLSANMGKSKFVLIDFWASWNDRCMQDMPALADIYTQYKEKGLEIIGVSLDMNQKQWLHAIKDNDLSWPQFLSTDNNSIKGYYISELPYRVLVDKEGKVVAENLNPSQLESKIEELLKK